MAKDHERLGPWSVNQATFVSNTDPATDPDNFVTKRKLWVQTDDDTTPTEVLAVKIRNEANNAWIQVTLGSGAFDPADYIAKAFFAAKGDLISASADNTPAILPVGATAGHRLEVAPGEATGLKYAADRVELGFAVSDETTAITAGVGKLTFRMPHAMTLTAVRASLTGAASSGTVTVDINEAGVSILSTKLTIDASEKTSTTAAVPAVISDATLADDAEITIDVDDDGAGDATGLKVWLIGTRA